MANKQYQIPIEVTPGGGGGGTTVNINGSSVSNPNFNATTPAASGTKTNVDWQVSGSSVSAELLLAQTTTRTANSFFTSYSATTGNFGQSTIAAADYPTMIGDSGLGGTKGAVLPLPETP